MDYSTFRHRYRIRDYHNLQQAMHHCKRYRNCKGISQIHHNRFRLYRDDKPIFSSTRKSWFRGGPAVNKFTYDTTFGGFGWTVTGPARLEGRADGREYPNRKRAMRVSFLLSSDNFVSVGETCEIQ